MRYSMVRKEGDKMKKLLKAGIAGAIACSALVGTVSPVSANTVSGTLQNSVQDAATEITPRFMYTMERTYSSWEFDALVVFDTAETTQTSSGWRIVGFLDCEVYGRGRNIVSYAYTYKYYDNYQGLELDIEYIYVIAGINFTSNKTIRVHI